MQKLFDELYEKFQSKCVNCTDKDCYDLMEVVLNKWWEENTREIEERC